MKKFNCFLTVKLISMRCVILSIVLLTAYMSALDQLLGAGIALQALISADGKHIIYGKVFKLYRMDIKKFGSRFLATCTFNHDAELMQKCGIVDESAAKKSLSILIFVLI